MHSQRGSRTWLISNVEIGRAMAKRHQKSLQDIHEKVEGIKERFQLQSIEYRPDWSVSQFYACLTTFMIYADKWHDRLLTLRGTSEFEYGSSTNDSSTISPFSRA